MSSFWHNRSLTGIVDHRPHTPYGKRAEDLFLSIPNEQSAIDASRKFATKPHMAGTDGDLQTARDFLTLLQTELGVHTPSHEPLFHAGSHQSQKATRGIPKLHHPKAWIDQYFPVMNTPLDRSLQVLDEDGSVLWDADLTEHADDTDPEAGKYADAVPTFHGLSKGGDDYENLDQKDVSLNGSIVLCRYGGIFRGLKVKGGQDRGAAGVLIYSDPRDDGSVTEENGYAPYPHGPARNPTSVQRGSVQYLSMYPGDPTTPGYPSYENSTRTEASNIPSIPSLPISWANAQNLFKVLEKGNSLEGKKVRLVNNVDTRVIPIWNTMGVIPGHIKNEVVVIGNHRDAWVMGAADPSSGTSSINEVVRGLGYLIKQGWKPLRTIVIASWDAEEYGLIGSTEWGEDFGDWIEDHVVAYINLDGSCSGSRFSVKGSPLLAHLLRDIALELPHPTDKDRTMWDARNDEGTFFEQNLQSNHTIPKEVLAMRDMEKSMVDELGVGVLGSGSDYTVFLQRIGVRDMTIYTDGGGFGGTLDDAAYHYHSVYDSERWMEVYADPGFSRHVAAAKFSIKFVILPFNTTHYAFELEKYLDQVEDIADLESLNIRFSSLRNSLHSLQKASAGLDKEKLAAVKELRDIIGKWKKRRSSVRRKLRKAYCRIKKALGKKCECPHKRKDSEYVKDMARVINVPRSENNLHACTGRFPALLQGQEESDIVYGIAVEAGFDGPRHLLDFSSAHPHHHYPLRKLRRAIKKIQTVNKKLTAFERGLISKDGIKDREWYKHLGVAPGKWLGYGATTLPALTEALTYDKNTTLAQQEADRLKTLIDRLAEHIKVN
ncbi:Zn-dependent exopeptidase [Cyathus striatus]|nr:Zn-dependent exopeptidase [Cyathus striatus]